MGARVRYAGRQYLLKDKESVLDCLLRENNSVPHSCKAGVCQACIMKLENGTISDIAQKGLKDTLVRQGFFLACQCFPDSDIAVQTADDDDLIVRAHITGKSLLNHNVLQILMRAEHGIDFQAGQYLTITANIDGDDVTRSYSIANLPDGKNKDIALHVRVIPNGKMSVWLKEKAESGNEVVIRGPAGDCFYIEQENSDYPLVLAGTGTGLAPLYGILSEAIRNGHKGNISLYHGALKEEDLYFVEELTKISEENPKFSYVPCVFKGSEGAFYKTGNIEDIVMNNLPKDKKHTRLYLCGAPDMVNSLRTKAFLAGVSNRNIYADAFIPSKI